MKQKLLFRGPVLTSSGYGVHARQLLRALIDSGDFEIQVESIRWGDTGFLTSDTTWIDELVEKQIGEPDVSVQVTIPNEFKRNAKFCIGVTAGIEVDRVSPEWLAKCNAEVDLVVVPSAHSAQAFSVVYQDNKGNSLRLEKPLFVVPEGVDTSVFKAFEKERVPVLDGMPEKNLIFVGLGLDKPRGLDRKNVTRLIEWFCKKFSGRTDIGLILKTAVVNSSLVDFETTKRRIAEIKNSVGCGEFPKIRLIHGRLQEQEFASLYNDPRVIASISVTHGEGYGLPLIEAASCGLPVVATNWSGHLEFLLDQDGKPQYIPIESRLGELPDECVWEGVLDKGTKWAEPSEESFGVAVDTLLSDIDGSKNVALNLMQRIHERFSLQETGKMFSTLVKTTNQQVKESAPPTTREELIKALRKQYPDGKDWVVYTMPMSAGDVFLSSALFSALKARHQNKKIVLATDQKYASIAEGIWEEAIQWHPWMTDISILEDVFSDVYTPNLSIQMVHSNWVHKGLGRNILEEMAVHCRIPVEKIESPVIRTEKYGEIDENFCNVMIHAGSGEGQWGARRYAHWQDLVLNLKRIGCKITQVGSKEDEEIPGVDEDLRGKTSYNQLAWILEKNCDVFVGIDSLPMHIAASYSIPLVALFGGSYPTSTGPLKRSSLTVLLETPSRNGCDKACYKNECFVDKTNPCINNISPKDVFKKVCVFLGKSDDEFEIKYPKIAGYTHLLNAETHQYPYIQSIKSMLGFCDYVIVVDGGSKDGTLEKVKAIGDDRIQIIEREWDPTEPGMDGMQKAFGRAMCPPDAEFLWQQDADEIVHEKDYQKIKELTKRFPAGVKLVHLPIVEIWGNKESDSLNVRTDRHSWKWRLSRNDFRITHGIHKNARLMDQKTGRLYAKEGQSDGCEYIDVVTGEYIPHAGFYNSELERLRIQEPQEYGKKMIEIFDGLPSVYHYSWYNLERKIKNFRDFWDKQWSVLYGETEPKPRFPDVITDEDIVKKAEEMYHQGGEHGKAETFKYNISQPKVMNND